MAKSSVASKSGGKPPKATAEKMRNDGNSIATVGQITSMVSDFIMEKEIRKPSTASTKIPPLRGVNKDVRDHLIDDSMSDMLMH